MKLHTVFITYNRLELTKRAVESYLETVSVPHYMMIVDNGSTDGTQEWLRHLADFSETPYEFQLLPENRYPGYACNRGWEFARSDVTHLQRADNDNEFLPGWCEEVERMFWDGNVGQVGLRTDEQDAHNFINVAGDCVIRRELWDKGLRCDERPWPEYDPGWSEDAFLSKAVVEMGYRWRRVKRPCLNMLGTGDWNDEYYFKSFTDRGLIPPPCT